MRCSARFCRCSTSMAFFRRFSSIMAFTMASLRSMRLRDSSARRSCSASASADLRACSASLARRCSSRRSASRRQRARSSFSICWMTFSRAASSFASFLRLRSSSSALYFFSRLMAWRFAADSAWRAATISSCSFLRFASASSAATIFCCCIIMIFSFSTSRSSSFFWRLTMDAKRLRSRSTICACALAAVSEALSFLIVAGSVTPTGCSARRPMFCVSRNSMMWLRCSRTISIFWSRLRW
mmetsp:Transcript_29084/g.93042  ORF Transcript_29084/g.93042 Transcript_29084/m.93042 type:complete len:241 (-) Transcript_29084:384-1106(-)